MDNKNVIKHQEKPKKMTKLEILISAAKGIAFALLLLGIG